MQPAHCVALSAAPLTRVRRPARQPTSPFAFLVNAMLHFAKTNSSAVPRVSRPWHALPKTLDISTLNQPKVHLNTCCKRVARPCTRFVDPT